MRKLASGTRLLTIATVVVTFLFGTTSAFSQRIWLTKAEIMALPTSGSAWTNVKAVADSALGTPDVDCQSNNHDVKTYAVALVATRTGLASYKTKARDAIAVAMTSDKDTWNCAGTRSAGLGRNLATYVIAADVLNLATVDPALDTKFRTWIRGLLTKPDGSWTVQSLADKRPSNVGTMSAASATAVAAYLNDTTLLAKMAREFKGWLGDRTSYTGFSTPADGTTNWLVDPTQPRYVSPYGGVLKSLGRSLDGALPAEMVRGGSPTWCPGKTDYPWAALSGTYVEAELLYRAGYVDVYQAQNNAIMRTMDFLHRLSVECSGTWSFPTHHSYNWMPWFINFAYNTNYPKKALNTSDLGFNMSFTDWTHNRRR